MARHGGNSGKTGKSGKTVRTMGFREGDKGVLAWEDWSEEGCAKNTPTFSNPLQRGLTVLHSGVCHTILPYSGVIDKTGCEAHCQITLVISHS